MTRPPPPASAVPSHVGLAGLVGFMLALLLWHVLRMPILPAMLCLLFLTGTPMWFLEWRRFRPSDLAIARPPTDSQHIASPKVRRQWRLRGLYFGAIPWLLALWMFETFTRWAIAGFWGLMSVVWPFVLAGLVRYVMVLPNAPPEGLELLGQWSSSRKALKTLPFQPLRDQLVKAYFLPLMTGSVFDSMASFWASTHGEWHSLSWFSLPVVLIFFIDTLFATVGYLSTSKRLDSHIRSSNPYWLGWAAALACYIPLIAWLHSAGLNFRDGIEWHHLVDQDSGIAFVWGAAIVATNASFTWATVTFGIRFSNLTNRGIITNGPYRYTKHPAYLAKNASWWLVSVPFVSAIGPRDAAIHCAALLTMNAIYVLRAKTEERHLMHDPSYREYAAWIAQHGVLARCRRLIAFPRGNLRMLPPRDPRIWLAVAAALAVWAYWIGLSGPFLLDDHYNFESLRSWLADGASLRSVLFDGKSGAFGRPVAMASFALSATLGGYTPFAFKLGNLLVHLACGAVIYALVSRMAARDPLMSAHARLTGLFVACAWLLHPLNASTVLYAVQRMAQLSTLCMLLAMWLFMAARERLGSGPSRIARAVLFVGIPLLAVAGFLSKENALLTTALCLVLELGCYRRAPRPTTVKAFFVLYLFLPFALGIAALALNPGRILGGYARRDFTLWERLMTQTRALCDYLWKIVAPNPPRMGVYTDDYAISTGLMAPSTTLLALLALLAITATAWRLRTRIPALATGWALFLVGHAIESGPISLELYFEHRNYLPMVGVLYALTGLGAAAAMALQRRGLRAGRILTVLATGMLGLFAFGTHGRARVWSDETSLVSSAVESHPQSLRANMALVKVALDRKEHAAASLALRRLSEADAPRTRALGLLSRLYLSCAIDGRADPRDLDAAMATMPPRATYAEPEIFGMIYRYSPNCRGIDDAMLADRLAGWLDRTQGQPDRSWAKWQLRHRAGLFYQRAGDWNNTLTQARLAWQPNAQPAVASLLIQAQLATGDLAGAERTLADARTRIDSANATDRAGIDWLRRRIDAARTSGR